MKHKWKNIRRGNEREEYPMNQLNSSTIAWRRMLISIYNRFSFLRFASFFLCIREVLLEDATARFIDPLQALSLSLSLRWKNDKFKKENYVIRDESVHIYISSSRGFRDSTFHVDTNLPVSLVSLASPKLAIKLHPRIGLHRSKKPRSSLRIFKSKGRWPKFKYVWRKAISFFIFSI